MSSVAAAVPELLFGQGRDGVTWGIRFSCIIDACGQSQTQPGGTLSPAGQGIKGLQRAGGAWSHSHHWGAASPRRDTAVSHSWEMRDLGPPGCHKK